MRIILHAGTHKTGTSSLQRALHRGRKWLGARGYVYPNLGNGLYNHNFLVRDFIAPGPGRVDFRSESWHRGHTLIISAEDIWGVMTVETDWDELCQADYWQRRTDRLARIRAALAQLGEISVFICLRRQDEFAASLYATKILSGRFHGSFGEFLTRSKPLFDYRKQLDAFEAVFDEVHTTSFDWLKVDLVPRFFSWAEIPMPPGDTTARYKVTPHAQLVEWVKSRSQLSDPEMHKLRAAFAKSKRASAMLPTAGSLGMWPSESARKQFLADCTDPEPSFFAPPASLGARTSMDFASIDGLFDDWRSKKRSQSRYAWASRVWSSFRGFKPAWAARLSFRLFSAVAVERDDLEKFLKSNDSSSFSGANVEKEPPDRSRLSRRAV